MTAALVLQTVALDTHRYRHSAAYPCRSFHFSCKGQLNIPGLNCSLHSHLSTASWKTHPPPCRWILHSSNGVQCKNKKSLCFVFALAGMTVPPNKNQIHLSVWNVWSGLCNLSHSPQHRKFRQTSETDCLWILARKFFCLQKKTIMGTRA